MENWGELIDNEINSNGWEIFPNVQECKEARYKNTETTVVDVQFSMTLKGCSIYTFLNNPIIITKWYPFLHSVEKRGDEYIGMILSPLAQTFVPYKFNFFASVNNTSFTVVLQGVPKILIILKEMGNECITHILYYQNAQPIQLLSSCLLIFKCLSAALSGIEEYRILVSMEHACYPRYTSPPLSRYIHESQRVRITANEEGNEMFIQADIKVPLRPQTFYDLVTTKNGLMSIISENIGIKDGPILSYRHLQFSPLVQPSISMDIVQGSRITPDWMALIFKTTQYPGCLHEHHSLIEFKESVISFRHCDDDDTRVRFSILLNLPIIHSFPLPLREKFLSNLVAPTLYYFATIASPSLLTPPKVFPTDPNLPEMITIESMSSLLLNAITLSKTKQKQVTTLTSLPDSILLKIFSYLRIDSIRNVQLLCKSFFSLINGSLAVETWKGIYHSTCYYNGRLHPEETKENLMNVAKIQALWRTTEFKPTVQQFGEKAITAIDINGSIFIGNEDGESQEIIKEKYTQKKYKKSLSSVCGIKRIGRTTYIGYGDGKISIIGENKEETKIVKSHTKMDFSLDGRYCYGWGKSISVIELESGSIVNEYEPHMATITQVKEMKNLLISSSLDKTIKVFDRRSNAITMDLKGHSNAVKGFDVTGEWQIISCGDEKASIAWDIRTGKMLCKSDLAVIPTCMATFNRKVICCGTNGQVVLQWNKITLGDRRYIFKVPNIPTSVSLDDDIVVVGTSNGLIYLAPI
ncbi:hypothetical protein ENUP19_0274G0051 [Entamoeba nuttalli]|uniref:F-box/WD domain containing protein n=2 Tax=Entamoeba nuttalli TaxID=412467 RepID=K2H902_ENTNP|nr:F-box/WD domain containing protein [Entamoeba nuttalli P19]EKE39034.1 F-box/WD domain containing protein [Entamoeba nuttalli P19]|eukprot:XP_008858630.1 F-box/WD domain containing protein [Entamoeba nuttalli P19]